MSDGSDTGKGCNDSGTGGRATPTVNKYVAELYRLVPIEQVGQFAFRGQADSSWNLESTAYRRHKQHTSLEEELMEEELIKYNRNLVDEAKNANYHQKENKELKDIEMLAELRHYSAATALIDFTRDFLVALWFACGPTKGDSQEGTVFLVNTGDADKFLQLTSQDKEKSLEEILRFQTRKRQNDATGMDKGPTAPPPELWYWEPRFEINHRLSSQKGVFIFGKDNIPCQEIKIRGKDKEAIRKELSSLWDINEKRLFNDLPGFATLNDVNHKLPKDWTDYFRAGELHMQRGEWEKAIDQYNKTIGRKSKYAEAYRKRGIAQAILGRRKEAISDLDQAITLAPESTMAHFNRACVNVQLGDTAAARDGFNKALDLATNQGDKALAKYIQKNLDHLPPI